MEPVGHGRHVVPGLLCWLAAITSDLQILTNCLTNLILFYDKVTHLVDEGKAVDVICLHFSKASDTVSHSILLEKLAAHGLDGCTLCW
ncbi:hypothetical protein QYF61_002481 [Mycteria americana]|uniref:Rna-directed dna polymerase from mobile element jockey-like n=1 Tax=Mycteria americana TaxID=33587 RepID=A0AAN7SGQ3_MYCAM|nr:hypothetical protein QYF61_002481 [Mycteria americana]